MRLSEFADQRSYTLPPRRWQPFSNCWKVFGTSCLPSFRTDNI